MTPNVPHHKVVAITLIKISSLSLSCIARRDSRGCTAVCHTIGRCSKLVTRKIKNHKKGRASQKGPIFFIYRTSYIMFFPSLGIGLTHRWKRTEGRNCAKGTPPFEINFSWNAMTVEASKDLFIYKQSDLLIDNVLHS